jgi:peptide/nickel transport system permease protein
LDAANNPILDKAGKVVKDPRGLSVLDRFFCVWDENRRMLTVRKEETYSAPLADQTFVKESKVGDDGQVSREYAPLKHKGEYLLGTDQVGRDVLWLSLKGVRTGLIIGLLTTMLALPFAIFFGLSAGYFRGWVDDVVQFVYTVLGSIPSLLLIIAFMVLYDRGLPQLVFIMGITGWVGLCRLLRGETLKLRELEYVQAARALGAGPFSIIRRHLLPNVMHLVVIQVVLGFSGLVLAESVLSYLGVGVGTDTGSWGNMINLARYELARDPLIWWPIASAFVMMLGLVLPANLFGDCLRDALDPRLRK